MGWLTPEQVQVATTEARLTKELLGHYLVRHALITPQQLCQGLSLQSGLPSVDFPDLNVPLAAKYAHALMTMERFELVPFSETDQVVCVAAKRALSPRRIPEIEASFAKKVRVHLAPDEQIAAMLGSLGGARPTERRRHRRYQMLMAIWLQLCGARNEPLGPNHGGRILNVSLGGLQAQAPDAMAAQVKALGRSEQKVLVRFSTPPLAVHGICIVRYIIRKENAQSWEDPWFVGLEFKSMEDAERENLRLLHQRAEIGLQRLEVEFGEESADTRQH